MTFEECIDIILQLEGGYSFDFNDPGGETNWGISKRAFPSVNIKDLTRDEAKVIYRQVYWEKMSCDRLPPDVRLAVFDCAVNQGVTRATLFLQKALGVKKDGVIGPNTIRAFAGVPPETFLTNFLMQRFDAYAGNPLWTTYGRGWMKRLMQITLYSLS